MTFGGSLRSVLDFINISSTAQELSVKHPWGVRTNSLKGQMDLSGTSSCHKSRWNVVKFLQFLQFLTVMVLTFALLQCFIVKTYKNVHAFIGTGKSMLYFMRPELDYRRNLIVRISLELKHFFFKCSSHAVKTWWQHVVNYVSNINRVNCLQCKETKEIPVQTSVELLSLKCYN